jgi:ribosomal protein S18 acetylase RimI-like enzyme
LARAFTIREATPEDRDALARMMQALNRTEDAITHDRTTDLESAVKHVTHLENIVMDDGGCLLVADAGGAAIGFLIAFVEEDDGFYLKPEARKHGYISDLYVVAAMRGRGVAKALMAEAEAQFRAMGISRVQIGVLVANRGASALYEKQGYRTRSLFLEKDL